IEAQPNKLFEYMQYGLPIVGSRFDLWKDIVEENYCGILVDPLNPKEISEAIKWIYDNPDEAKKMGENGMKAVKEKYNWQVEEKKLIKLYEEISSV
ncbi:MAG: glycosyltransferase, partial [Acidimicrobiia bacterium]|nr:glycosyltransferase [Acidimicrobiia bacterium]